ncbi:hypothetical protein [Vitreimonas flagellata]|uniref:hypothetical protein n=1 Tax=Vitreimonas flagellata TaxID=2560861 RepID=UPI001074C86E|nr:hypothetical protein [Vitreimonas flagellata]
MKAWMMFAPLATILGAVLAGMLAIGPLALGAVVASNAFAKVLAAIMAFTVALVVFAIVVPGRGVWRGRLHTGWLSPSHALADVAHIEHTKEGVSIALRATPEPQDWKGLVLRL